ncbi:DUF1402 family protein [Ahrensia sp. R2A130]|uniref:DUF1402 family protein n=1 Tax=Ahrensia sp. R2A130 TaxID=744979 RepID=UPI0001E0B49F|nr:DUF1402 family protein [Ahrensia sp. R2A130]EFL89724.1 conserved hypothetical protein [Ahrensia sp. R2A130]
MFRALLLSLALSLSVPAASSIAVAQTVVPPGNNSSTQPKIPAGSVKRSRALGYEAKYTKIRNLIARDSKLRGKIKKAAATFGIDPIHIVGALVGEHTYNVDAKDRLQSYYVKALAYLGQDLSFGHKGTSITKLVGQPAFAKCKSQRSSYPYWTCIENVWDSQYRGKSIAGKRWPNDRLGRVFFQPFYAGQTFGLGQLNPLTALKANDLVRSRIPREPKLSVRRAPEIYNTIMEPDSTLNYMAAVIRHAIDSYRSVAGFDISRNPGITATLYNLGNVPRRANTLRVNNAKRKAAGKKPLLPRENYYGWLVNEKEADLRSIL